MFWQQAGSTLVIATIMTGCTSAPMTIEPEKMTNDQSISANHPDDDSVAYDGYFNGASTHEVAKCEKVATSGSRLKRLTCVRGKDQSDLFSVIDTGGSIRHSN